MIDVAYAQGAGGAGGAGGGFSMLVPLLLMFGVFYFLLIRPQQKKQKEHEELMKNLKAGHKILTSGGIIGVRARSARTLAAPARTRNSALRVWWSSTAAGNGTSSAPRPAAASSDTVRAP